MIAVAALAALLFLAWQEAKRAEVLHAELERAALERQAMVDRLHALEATAAALDQRLAVVEASSPSPSFAAQLESLEQELELARSAVPAEAAELAELQASLLALQRQVDELQLGFSGPGAGTQSSEAAAELPPEARLVVGRQRQSHNLSCESAATSMVAQYFGLDLSESEVLAALPIHDNPHLGFRGNVDGPTGGTKDYGVYSGPILDVLNDQGLQAWPVNGGLDGIKRAIARGNPVIAWVTYDCQPSTPKTKEIDGETVVLVPWQHVVVVTGYEADGVWANDPWDGKEDFYPTADFERAMGYFGEMAVEVASP
jgi:uncharacterized protein YvpB